MDPELRDIIRLVANEAATDSHTHITTYGPRCRWTIPPHNQTNFWTSYCELVDKNRRGREDIPIDPFANFCLAEHPHDIMPLISKFTLRFHADDENWEPYDEVFLEHVCHTYQSVILENFQINVETQMELVVAVLESNSHWFEEDRETGHRYMLLELRIQFPYARIELGLQSRLIRSEVIRRLRNNNVMAKMMRQPIGDWEQIICTNIINEPVIMFGSSEIQGRPKLELTHIWPYISEDILDGDIQLDEIILEDAFIPQNHIHFQQGTLDGRIFDQDYALEYWLPVFLSVGYWPTVLSPKENTDDKRRYKDGAKNNSEQYNDGVSMFGAKGRNNDMNDNEMELAERLLQMLKSERFLKESFWLDIGKALYSSDEGGENGLLSWIRYTERALIGISSIPDYLKTSESINETCSALYYTFAGSNITAKTIGWYAREDSPESYGNWHKEWCMSSMEDALSASHTDVTIALYRVYWLDFVYCPLGGGRWFQFKNHRWHEVNQGIALRKYVSSDFMRRFEAARVILSRQIRDATEDNFKTNAELTMKKITSLIGKLKSVPFKSCVITESREHFNHDKFLSLLDGNSDLLGLTNGVIEIIGQWAIHRRSKPEDYVSMCTNIPYQSSFNWTHPLVSECMKWFGQVFPDQTLLHHFLKFAASCLKGRNSDKIFPIWTGEGDNSKSMIVKLFEATFNCYCIKFPVSLLTEKGGNSSGPTPQLARAKSTRIAFLDEPEDDIELAKGTIKRYTGGDSFFARLLQDNGGDVQATFKMILMCNKVPIIPNADRAIKNRTRLFPFLATYCDDAPDDESEQYRLRRFKKNPLFERRITILAPAFLWILTQYFPHYSSEGLSDPQIVKDTTETYWKENDVYAQFTADMLQEVYTPSGDRENSARVTLSEIYSEFKAWFRDAFPGTKVPERQVVRNELSSRWGKMTGNAWHGIRIAQDAGALDMTVALGGKKKPAERPIINGPPAKIEKAEGKPIIPDMIVPDAIIPDVIIPNIIQSGIIHPDTSQSDIKNPNTSQSDIKNPNTIYPGIVNNNPNIVYPNIFNNGPNTVYPNIVNNGPNTTGKKLTPPKISTPSRISTPSKSSRDSIYSTASTASRDSTPSKNSRDSIYSRDSTPSKNSRNSTPSKNSRASTPSTPPTPLTISEILRNSVSLKNPRIPTPSKSSSRSASSTSSAYPTPPSSPAQLTGLTTPKFSTPSKSLTTSKSLTPPKVLIPATKNSQSYLQISESVSPIKNLPNTNYAINLSQISRSPRLPRSPVSFRTPRVPANALAEKNFNDFPRERDVIDNDDMKLTDNYPLIPLDSPIGSVTNSPVTQSDIQIVPINDNDILYGIPNGKVNF